MIKKKNQSKESKKTKKNITTLVVVIVCLSVAIALLFAFMQGWFSPNETRPPSQSTLPTGSQTQPPTGSYTPSDTTIPTPSGTPDVENPIPDGHIKISSIDELKSYLEYVVGKQTGIYGLSVYDYTNDKNIDIAKSETFNTLTSYRLVVAMYAVDQANKSELPLDSLVEYTVNDYAGHSEIVGKGKYSDTHSIRKLCEYMLVYDDVAALNMLVRVYGMQNIANYMSKMGMTSDLFSFSSSDMILCFKSFKERVDADIPGYPELYNYLVATKAYEQYSISDEALSATSKSTVTSVSFDNNSFNNAMTVYAKNIYVVSLTAKNAQIEQASQCFAKINSVLYKFFTENEVVVEKDALSHVVVLDEIDAFAKQTASKLKTYIMLPDQSIVSTYISKDNISFPNSKDYSDLDGVPTFRGSNYRDGGSYGTVKVEEEKLEEVWSYKIGGMTGAGSIWPGVGWTGQPCIVKWDYDVLQTMNVYDKFKTKTDFVEVIYGTLDGNVYFLDLETGEASRNYIQIGVPIKGTLSIDPRGYPLMYVGQGLEAAMTNEGEDRYRAFGYRIFSLIDQSLLYEVKGYDTFAPRMGWGAFDSSGLFDIENDTYYECGENGVIYVIKMNTEFDKTAKTIKINPIVTRFKYISGGAYNYGIESSPSIYEKYMYVTDNTGMLICLDLESLRILWAYNTGDDTDASVALDVTKEGVFLYTSNEIDDRAQNDSSNIRKFNALTGELLWQVDVPCYFVDVINGGALASPIIGKGDMEDLVIFNICKTIDGGVWTGSLFAISKTTGQIVWEHKLPYSWSSPVAVYTADNKGYIVFCLNNGTISLLEGSTGKLVNELKLSAGRMYYTIEATPAIYGDMLVIGTYAEKIYGVRIK